MRSAVRDLLPPALKRMLKQWGEHVNVSRRKRRITVAMMAERTGLSMSTYLRVERGDPTVSMGAFAMTLFVLGLDQDVNRVMNSATDDQGLLLEEQLLPKRVRPPKATL
jgi:transcriptional regulator with XRE-family HTH domain